MSNFVDSGCRGIYCLANSVCIVLYGLGLVSASPAVLAWFCVVFCWSVLVSLRLYLVLCGSVWFRVGFRWSRCVCVILYGLGLVSAGLAVLVWFCMVLCWSVVAALSLCNSVWSWVGFSWPRCVCLVVYFGLVSAGLAAFVWFYVEDLIICLVV